MWVQVFGAPGTGKHEIVKVLEKQGYLFLKGTPVDPTLTAFEQQQAYTLSRIRVSVDAMKLQNRRDIVTVRGFHDTQLVYSTVMRKQERFTDGEFAKLKAIYDEFFTAIDAPNCTIFTFASALNAMDRMALRQTSMPQGDYNDLLVAYKEFAETVRIPQVEVNFDEPMDRLRKDFDFNFASLKTTAVASQTLWQREFLHGTK